MSIRDEIKFFLRQCPGSRVHTIAAHLGKPEKVVGKAVYQMTSTGWLKAEVVGHTITNVPIKGYTLTDKQPGKPGVPKGTKMPRKKMVVPPKPTPLESVVSAETTVTPPNLDAMLDGMAAAMVQQLVARVKAQLPTALTAALPAQEVKVATPQITMGEPRPVAAQDEGTVRTRKTRIALIGVLKTQQAAIDNSLNGSAVTRGWCSGDGFAALGALAAWADVAFIMTGKVSHAAQQLVQAHLNATRVVPVSGGPTAMKRAIAKHFAKEAV